jgi:hypothetical protein
LRGAAQAPIIEVESSISDTQLSSSRRELAFQDASFPSGKHRLAALAGAFLSAAWFSNIAALKAPVFDHGFPILTRPAVLLRE